VRFALPLLPGRLIRRYKRFLADIELESGETITALTPNTGSMKGLIVPGAPVRVSVSDSETRKYKHTWEMVCIDGGWAGINTHLTNVIAAEALDRGVIPAFRRYRSYRREVKIADGTRIDFVLGTRGICLVEVKNVTLVEDRAARFPDAVTTRGQKHLRHLTEAARRGKKAAMLYVVQHHAGEYFEPADDIDPEYGRLLRRARDAGVRIEAWRAKVAPLGIELAERLSVRL